MKARWRRDLRQTISQQRDAEVIAITRYGKLLFRVVLDCSHNVGVDAGTEFAGSVWK